MSKTEVPATTYEPVTSDGTCAGLEPHWNGRLHRGVPPPSLRNRKRHANAVGSTHAAVVCVAAAMYIPSDDIVTAWLEPRIPREETLMSGEVRTGTAGVAESRSKSRTDPTVDPATAHRPSAEMSTDFTEEPVARDPSRTKTYWWVASAYGAYRVTKTVDARSARTNTAGARTALLSPRCRSGDADAPGPPGREGDERGLMLSACQECSRKNAHQSATREVRLLPNHFHRVKYRRSSSSPDMEPGTITLDRESFKALASEVRVEVLKQSEERRVGKECRSRWSPYH